MRIPFVAGNWKMNKTVAEARMLAAEILPELRKLSAVERVICPPYTSLEALSGILSGSGVGLGAQDMHWESSGAFTGEIAPNMVAEFCQYVIIGHSERRAWFGETDEFVNKKTQSALNSGLIPIVCVGETLEEKESGRTAEVVMRQMLKGLQGTPVEMARQIVIAYEPVWAIGTGLAASGEDANKVVSAYIRSILDALFGVQISQTVRVLYGGSVNSGNSAEFFQQPEIDGALVGGASLKSADFIKIVQAAAR